MIDEVAPPQEKKSKLSVKTLFISDVHLGVPECKAAQASHFLRNTLCEKLVMNGDIIDAWHLRRSGGWNKGHTHFVRTVLRKMEKEGTEVLYLRGNHDDILDRFLPLKLENFHLTDEYIHPGRGGNYLVVHGDGFDAVTTKHPWMAKAGAIGYNLLLKLNRIYNGWRRWRGKENFSLSRWVKLKVKSAVSFVGRYEEQLQQLAEWKKCRGIICGHIHQPANKMIGSVHYLNSGDWVESMTAILEHHDGSFEVITYDEFCQRTHRQPKGDAVSTGVTDQPKMPLESSVNVA
jgi:UDP-2,3-diacylglucosamine pyrophosphatase LpxH